MLQSFAAFAESVELETFFSGFCVIYILYWLYFRNAGHTVLAYALVATCYWALQIRNYYPHYDLQNVFFSASFPLLKAWGAAAILLWIPAIRKRSLLAFLHSVVFFCWLMTKMFTDPDNSIKIFAVSIIINSCSLILILLLSWLGKGRFHSKKSPDNSQRSS